MKTPAITGLNPQPRKRARQMAVIARRTNHPAIASHRQHGQTPSANMSAGAASARQKPLSQLAQILAFLSRGHVLTRYSAKRLFDVTQLKARVHDARKLGYRVRSEPVRLTSGRTISVYSL